MTDQEATIIAKQFLAEQKEIEERDELGVDILRDIPPDFFDDQDF